MDYKKTDSEQWPHQLTFDKDEIATMRAAYTELLINRELAESGSNVRSWERSLSLYPRKNRAMVWHVASLGYIADALANFSACTEYEVGEILKLPVPKFENQAAVKRRKYGEIALRLAGEMREITRLEQPPTEVEAQLFAAQLEVMGDDDIRELWEPPREDD